MRIAVAMATHQGARHLEQQLASLAAQTRLPDALHVHDDASTDATWSLLQTFERKAPFAVHLTRSERHAGVTASFEAAILAIGTDTDVIALCDQDDVWLPHKIERLASELDGPSRGSLAFSDAYLIDDRGRREPTRRWEAPGFDRRRQARVRADPFGQLVNHYLVSGCQLAFRTDHRDLLLPFPAELRVDEGLEVLHDTWITMVLSAVGEVAVVDEALLEYRVHADQAVGVPRATRLRSLAPAVLRWRLVGSRTRNDVHHRRGLVELLAVIEHRLEAGAPGRVPVTAIDDVRGARRHLQARNAVDRPRRARIGTVAAEVRAGRYRRFSFGLASAAADLVRRPQPPT
jgi:glycosyltransferase involved in cell wall biosynthesis